MRAQRYLAALDRCAEGRLLPEQFACHPAPLSALPREDESNSAVFGIRNAAICLRRTLLAGRESSQPIDEFRAALGYKYRTAVQRRAMQRCGRTDVSQRLRI